MVKKISTLLALALFLIGCDSQSDTFSGDTGLYVNVKTDLSYNMNEGEYSAGRADFDLSGIITIPSVSDFSMSLYSVVDGGVETLLNTWESVDDFQAGSQFSPGTYRVEVCYGTVTDEGENKPYFVGTKTFEVEADKLTKVEITAELQNSFVKATVSDNFKEYFLSGNLSIVAEGKNPVVLSPLSNSTPVFVRPGVVDFVWDGTRQGGNVSATIKSQLELVRKTGYTLNLDVDASKNQLLVQYDNSVEYITYEIVASNDPIVAMPVIQTEGFVSGTTVTFSKSSPIESLRFLMVADGNINDCIMTLNTATAVMLGCDEQMSLVSSTAQSLLAMKGLKIRGLDSKRGRMAFVEFSDLLKEMSLGTYSFSIVLTDSYNRATSPVVLKVNVTE